MIFCLKKVSLLIEIYFMKKIKKLRGGKRRLRNIKFWIENNKNLDLDGLIQHEREYVKFHVAPWSWLELKTIYPQPKKAHKNAILLGLIEIYTAWQEQLDALKSPYYLKIWWFEKNIKKSQVVCAIQSKIDFYENTFSKPDHSSALKKEFPLKNIVSNTERFVWEMQLDELYIEDDYLSEISEYESDKDYLENRKWFNQVVLKNHKRIYTHEDQRKFYVLDNDYVWIGEKTKKA